MKPRLNVNAVMISLTRSAVTRPARVLALLGCGVDDCRCADVDECRSSERICTNGACVNTPGSFRCDCRRGYEVAPTGDECHGNDAALYCILIANHQRGRVAVGTGYSEV